MDEFTQPASESNEASGSEKGSSKGDFADARNTHGAQVGPKPGVVGTGMVDVATDASLEPLSVAVDEPGAVGRRLGAVNPREQFAKLARLAVSAGDKILARLFPLADRAVAVLEKTDGLFTWMKEPIRRGIGLLAIATLGTSVFVFLWSLI